MVQESVPVLIRYAVLRRALLACATAHAAPFACGAHLREEHSARRWTLERGDPRGGIEVTPDGKYAYVTNGPLGTIAVIDAATLEVTRTIGGFGRADSSGHFIGPAPLLDAVEYYNPVLDHYFLTAAPTEIYALDAGSVAGWARTGQTQRRRCGGLRARRNRDGRALNSLRGYTSTLAVGATQQ
jgi:YVTN family beta-propeller protein